MPSSRDRSLRTAGVGLALVSLLLIAASDNWRTALLALVAGSAVAATRIRFAAYAAAALLALTGVLLLGLPR